jgi:hypothetical protein
MQLFHGDQLTFVAELNFVVHGLFEIFFILCGKNYLTEEYSYSMVSTPPSQCFGVARGNF